jgi:integrase
MSGTTFAVRVWATERRPGKKGTTYRVNWRVGPRRRSRTFATAAQADSYRSKLMAAVREGQAFDLRSGEPASIKQEHSSDVTWYEFACDYIDMKWPHTSPKHRKGTAEVLASVTVALLEKQIADSPHTAREVRSALLNWGFNARRGSEQQPDDVTKLLSWVARNSPVLAVLRERRTIRPLLAQLSTRLDGNRAAPRTAAWRRSILSTALNYAVEISLIEENPVPLIRWSVPKASGLVERRSVVSPTQARALLAAVAETPLSGAQLVAFFGCLYYAALRPEEAAGLRASDLELPAEGWGWIFLERAAPEIDRQWSDSDSRRQDRELKHRAPGETRRVPCPPDLTRLLRSHLAKFGTGANGRLFCGVRGEPLAGVTYRRLWQRARAKALTPEQVASPLATRPYDLRHAAVSTWLNSGVGPTQVAEWAGHSVTVLLRIYAKCIDGQEEAALRLVDQVWR